MSGAGPDSETPRRTDARGFLLRGITGLGQAVLPVGAAIYASDAELALALAIGVLALGGIYLLGALFAYLRWTKLFYTVGRSEIRVESGLLERQVRSIPYDRIQDVSITQRPLARVLGLVELTFETGAGKGEDLALSYLATAEGERLRRMVRERREAAGDSDPAQGPLQEDAGQPLFAMGPQRVLTLGLFRFSLVVFGVAGAALAQFDDFLPFDLWDIDLWRDRLAGPGAWLAGLGGLAQAIGVALLLLVLGLSGVLTGIVRTVLTEWDFRLERTDRGFRRRRGLLTRTDVMMPVRRVQAIIVSTGVVRARFGWSALSLVSLASDAGASHHDAAPLARADEVSGLVAQTGLRMPDETVRWTRISRICAVVEAMAALRWWIVWACAIAIVQGLVSPGEPWSAPWLPALPLAWGAWRGVRVALALLRTRYAIDGDQLYLAAGWLARSVTVCPREKLHSAAIRQGPVGRRAGYAHLVLGLAGSSLQIPGMIVTEARSYREHLLASMRRRDFADIN